MSDEEEKVDLKSFGKKMNVFGWNLFSCAAQRDKTRVPDTGVSPATMLIQLGGIGLGSGNRRGAMEVEKLIGNLRLEKAANELFKAGEHRSCYKWYPAMVMVTPTGRPVEAQMIEDGRKKYGMLVRTSDMKQDKGKSAVAMINKLVGETCEEHITEMITPDKQLRAKDRGIVTATAVYFHPWWNVRFDRKKTKETLFYETPQRERHVQMMERDEVLPYTEGELAGGVRVQMVGLGCRRHEGVVFFVVPVIRFGLKEVIGAIDGEKMMGLVEKCVPKSVLLSVPKFLMTDTIDIADDLRAMGMREWFQPTLSQIQDGGDPLTISEMVHQTVVRMNEDGDAAETDETTEEDSTKSGQSIRVRCDQPFMFVFRNEATKAFWLIGTCARPVYPKK